jgi:ABC-type transport system substrate-binding protein/predicted Ser/Thr protein kinase
LAQGPLLPGDPARVGRYRLTGRLGAGGMGVVYLGTAKGGSPVAVKVLRPELAEDPEFRVRFSREVATLTRVEGMCTVRVIEADTDGPRPFLVTEYIDGPSLSDYVDARGPLGAEMLYGLATGLAEALSVIHAAGIIHRDLKPSNVILTARGPMVIDFGIAQALDATVLTQTGMTVGSIGFMSPEQVMGQAVTASDMFSWAVTIAYAASGAAPFGTGVAAAVFYRIMNTEPDITAVPDSLRPWVEAALAKEPQNRPTAEYLLRELTHTTTQPRASLDVPTQTILAQTWRPAAPLPLPGGQPASQGQPTGKGQWPGQSQSAGQGQWPEPWPAPTATGHGAPAQPWPTLPAPRPARRRPVRAYAAVAVAVVVAAAGTAVGLSLSGHSPKGGPPSGGSSASSGTAQPRTAAAFNVGLSSVVNPSDHKGGTLTFDAQGTPDSFDPGNTYLPWVMNFDRLFAMPMFTYKSCPGQCGLQLVPDLATGMGTVSADGMTWTFHIQSGVKFENGTVVTAADVKYAIERTYDRSVLGNGPTYYQVLLTDPGYPGPYKDRAKNLMGLTAIGTPNATTLVFHLQYPFPDLPYLLAFPNSAPVLPGADKGGDYQLHPLSTGPYMFSSYTQGARLALVPNPDWNPATDPNARQLPGKIVMNLNVNQADIDSGLLAGDVDVDAQGRGVGSSAQAKILSSSADKANADNPLNGFAQFMYINTKVAPLDNQHCREAVEYAADKTTIQTAWGGPANGQLASTVMPPVVLGYKSFDLYNALTKPGGDLAAARQQLAMCGQSGGFSTNLAYRNDNPQETAAATALRAALARVGIKVTLQGFSTDSYYDSGAGVTAYVHSHDIGIAAGVWQGDWPNGYGFLDNISAGNSIQPVDNTNISELNDSVINNLFVQSASAAGAARTAIWSRIDEQILKDAAILPGIYQKTVLYRPPNLTNVYVQPFYGMYNDAVLGVSS